MNPETPAPSPQPATPGAATLHAPVEAQPNLGLAVAAGLAASLVGAVVWAVVTVSTEMQIGWMAVGVGFLVGFAVGYFNPQRSPIFGYVGAILALVGCLLGNVFSILGFASSQEHISLLRAFEAVDIPSRMSAGFSPIDLLFYGIAIYEGYKFSVKGRRAKA